MKKPYKKAEIEIIKFETEDIITTSDENLPGEEINDTEDD